jgi:aryl-alcohol dehydrogenase-like predicted oxidoreductase
LWPPACDLGLGCVTFGREIDRAAAFAMMDHAAAEGIRFFDTAAAYGGGASESLVGEWLASRNSRAVVTVATKLLPPYSPAALQTAAATSLARLKIDRVDVLFLHRWDDLVLAESTLRALDALVRGGRVGSLALSNVSAEQLEQALARQRDLGMAPFRWVQNIHNYAVRGIDDGLRRTSRESGVSLMAYSPLGAGFLTGKHEQGVQPGSRFAIIPGHQNVYFNDLAWSRLARLRRVATRSGVPMVQLALAWAFHQPQIPLVLVGGRTPAHLDQALQARRADLGAWLAELDAGA